MQSTPLEVIPDNFEDMVVAHPMQVSRANTYGLEWYKLGVADSNAGRCLGKYLSANAVSVVEKVRLERGGKYLSVKDTV